MSFGPIPLENMIAFLVTDLAICLIPGPAVMVTVSHALPSGMRGAIGPILGINCGNFIWYGLSAIGLITLASQAPTAFTIMQFVGAAYLIYIGYRRFIAPDFASTLSTDGPANSIWGGFANGIAVHMANPKALLFYTAVLPQFLDMQRPVGPQILVLALITVFTESTGLITYSLIAAKGGKIAQAKGRTILLNRIAGSILIIVALLLAGFNIWG
jgi:homoserine/homoserine lactone efflux protein